MDVDGAPTASTSAHRMTPITRLHLDSAPELVRQRLLTLLRQSPNQMHAHETAIIDVGLQGVDVRMRRLFNRIVIDRLITGGKIEKLGVKNAQGKITLYIKLLPQVKDDEDAEAAPVASAVETFTPSLLANLPVDHQVANFLISAGTEGMTNRVRR